MSSDIIFRIKDGDGVVHDYAWDDSKLMLSEAIALEQQTGMDSANFAEGLKQRSFSAIRAMVWIMRVRGGETDLKVEQVDFNLLDMDIVNEDGTTTGVAPGKPQNRADRRGGKKRKR